MVAFLPWHLGRDMKGKSLYGTPQARSFGGFVASIGMSAQVVLFTPPGVTEHKGTLALPLQ